MPARRLERCSPRPGKPLCQRERIRAPGRDYKGSGTDFPAGGRKQAVGATERSKQDFLFFLPKQKAKEIC